MKTLQQLRQERLEILTQMQALKLKLAPIDQEIQSRYESQMRALYERQQKQHGTLTMRTEDGIPLQGEIDKKVKWKSDLLMEVAKGMSWDEVQQIFKVTFEIPEKTYKTLNTELLEKVDKARETTYGNLKISIKEE